MTTASKDTFQGSEYDATHASKDRAMRKERSNIFKRRGNNAFRQGDLDKALSCYNESINNIQDSAVLYTNRALTFIDLNMFEKAIEDCKNALKIDEDSMKAWLYLAKSYINLGDRQFEYAIRQLKNRHPTQSAYIDEYIHEVKRNMVLRKEMEEADKKDDVKVVTDSMMDGPPQLLRRKKKTKKRAKSKKRYVSRGYSESADSSTIM